MYRLIRRYALLTLIVLSLSLLGTSHQAQAQETPSPPTTLQAACPHTLRPGIPFAWLRFEPTIFSGFALTMTPGQTVQLNDPPITAWDGMQWWIYVWPNFSSARGYYWVELNSLEARCQPPTPTPDAGAAPWQPGSIVRVRLNVPFVWFRAAPAPGNPPIHTVLPGTQLVIVQGASLDSYNQWWWMVRDPRNGQTGWVEQNTVELVSGTPPTALPPEGWLPGDVVRVRANIPFAWLRSTPSSISDPVYTTRPRQELILQQGPLHDGTQNWWQVTVPYLNISGWVEANSLEFARRGS